MARRKRKSAVLKLFAKANKAVGRRVKGARKRIQQVTRKTGKFLARAGRKTAKQARKVRKTAKQFVTRTKRALRDRRRQNNKAATQARQDQRAREREFNRLTLSGDSDTSGAAFGDAKEGSGASKPGEPPKMRTGKGRKSITAELRMKGKEPQARVYVDKKVAGYMAMWEFRQDGKARPFLKPSVENNLNMFGAEIGNTLMQHLRPQAGKKKATVR